jgi:NodT family efflux transporter outer membrane factor (OMF) lipoprotein
MKHAFKTTCLSILSLLIMSSCTMLGPDYQVPTSPVQPEWIEVEDPLIDTTPPVTATWWQSAFGDPILDQLVATALAQNLSLRSAGLRVLQARQQLMIAIGNQYPQQQQLGGQAGIERLFSSSTEELYDLGFNLSWEADVWGRFKRQIESASAALDASVASYDGVMVSLISDVAQTYLLIRTTQQRLAVAQANLGYQKESVRITTAKFEGGEVSALDVEQAQSLFYNTRASVAVFEQSLQQFKNALAILLGQPPYGFSPLLVDPQPIPSVAADIAMGMPQDLIRRRPDIRVAERQLASQSAQIGFAITDLYPQFGISGAVGTSVSTAEGFQFSDLFDSDTSGYNLFGVFQWNIFNYGRLKNNVRLQDAIFQQLLEDYRQTVLQAQGEVENAIVAFLKSQQQLASYRLAADAAQRAVDISTEQYQDGLVGFNTVITTLRSLTTQQDLLASTQGTVATNLIEVYKALGGGWELRQGQTPLDLIPEETREEMLERTNYWEKTFKNE